MKKEKNVKAWQILMTASAYSVTQGFTPERDTHRIFMNFMEYSTYCIFKLNMWNIPEIP